MTKRIKASNQRPKGRWKSWVAGLNRHQRIRLRILQVLCGILLVLVALYGAYASFVRAPKLPVERPTPGNDTSTGQQAPDNLQGGKHRTGTYTFLLVGRDTGGGGNTDTMILASVDTDNKTLNAISLPRDTMVNVSWRTKKLNTVYNYYKGRDKKTQVERGMEALNSHVGKLTGIIPDFYILVEWDAVGDLVEALGGVKFDVPYDMHYDDPAQNLFIHQDKGERVLNGSDAMQVVRWRKNSKKYGGFQIGDSGRMKIQQDFLMAVAKECLQLKHVADIPKLANIFTQKVDTNLTVGNLIWFAQQVGGMNAETDIHFYTMPYTNYSRGTAYVLPVVDKLLAIINDGINPYEQEITAENLEVLVLQKDGSFKLTSGVLADRSLGRASSSGGGTTTTRPEPVEPENPETEEPTESEPSDLEPEGEHPELPPTEPEESVSTPNSDPTVQPDRAERKERIN